MTKCPDCGKDRGKLGTHWVQSKTCKYPELSDKQHDVLTGLLMGDGFVKKTSASQYIGTQMITREYLEYLNREVFPVLSTTVTQNNRGHYCWRTRALPELSEYKDWYSSGEKQFPQDIELSPTILKHWYVCDGSKTDTKNTSHIRIGLTNERDNELKIRSYFDSIGVDIQNWADYESGCSAIFNAEQSVQLWEYMGEPLAGFEYKWPDKYDDSI